MSGEHSARIRELAAQIARDLFTNGGGERATRLVLMENVRDLGGWGESVVADRIADALESHPDCSVVRESGADTEPERQKLIDYLNDQLRLHAMGYGEQFETIAERFYRETGLMAPGKSLPVELYSDEYERRRVAASDEWQTRRRQTWRDSLTAAIELLAVGRPKPSRAHRVTSEQSIAAFHPDIDVLMSVNQALHAVKSEWRIDVQLGQAVAVPVPDCFSTVMSEPSRATTEPPPEVRCTSSFDAADWARDFVAMVKWKPTIATDEGTMIGWFANALMRGFDEHARRSADALASPRAPQPTTWQPIESAPKDGTCVLLAYRVSRLASTTVGWFNGEKWRDEENTDLGPTHWMPLPDPPSGGEASKRTQDEKTTTKI